MAILLAMVGLLLRSALDGGAGVRAAAVAAIFCGWLAIVGVAVRPQLLAIIPFLLIARAAQAPPTNLAGRLALAAVVAIWANVHGSFVLAYALLGAGLLQAAWDRRTGDDRCRLLSLVWLTPLCAAAPLVNPYGPGLVRYVADAVLFNGVGGEVGVRALEWQPPTLRSVHGAAFFGSVVLVMALLARGQRPRAGEAALLLLFGLMSVQAVRNVVWWGFVLAPFLARGLSAWRTADRSGRAEGAG